MSEELSLSEEDRLLSGDPLPSDKPRRRAHTDEEQAVICYKTRLRKAKFYVGKANKRTLAYEDPKSTRGSGEGGRTKNKIRVPDAAEAGGFTPECIPPGVFKVTAYLYSPLLRVQASQLTYSRL
uniref:Uncharacterized protein n=1 Tax=Megaselia scalaris TaxID=36166 RepID=T1GRH4_MEGSC